MFKSPQIQYFSLPNTYISYIHQNPISTHGLEKLNQTCKYFFANQKVLIFSELAAVYRNGSIRSNKFKKREVLDLLKVDAKFWFSGQLFLYSFTCRLDRIFKCTVEYLKLYDTTLMFNEFEKLTAENTVIDFRSYNDSCIEYSDGTIVSIDVLLSMLPNVRHFEYYNNKEIYTGETLQKMNSINFNYILTNFSIRIANPADSFDPKLMCDFCDKNSSTSSLFNICLDSPNADKLVKEISIHKTPKLKGISTNTCHQVLSVR
uniref:Uncharacterized protein n=1 Tax=Panagrolaimus sp. PS1159 TaxID=55785 RepID=A0AC35FQV2_9BILA